jgi:hypothetical protein
MRLPNKPDSANPAMRLWLTIEDQWRRVADLERCANAVPAWFARFRRHFPLPR